MLDSGILDLATALAEARGSEAPLWTYDMISLIEQGSSALEVLAEIVSEHRHHSGIDSSKRVLPCESVRLLAPIPRPRKNVFGVGLNYREHVKEGAEVVGRSPEPPPYPTFFSKSPTSVIGTDEPVLLETAVTSELDYEAELGVIVGSAGRNLAPDTALDSVFGYTIINDISARDLQRRHTQWFKGKSLDTTCPMGPCIITRDEIPDPQNLDIRLQLNGAVMQSSNTRHMIFGVAELLSQLSAGMTLEPGDIIATGTPGGVGFTRKPPVFLRDGDMVEVEIEKIGVLRNGVRSIVDSEPY
jgi:2-keto-4-pentenoate hydratase/2-oxohepta-3-ene-1,7-dioic acid hydratase in catechol pathway